jgi:hypothetical protein
MPIERLRDVTNAATGAYAQGRTTYTSFRKVPAIASTQGGWVDLSMAPGNPKPNYYTADALTAAVLDGRTGIYHGGAVAPATKHLHTLLVGSVSSSMVPATFMLCDYLLFYALVDMDNADEQTLDNTLPLPRYATGAGVQAFLVATNPYAGGQYVTLRYTNSEGVPDRFTQPHLSNSLTTIGTLVTGGATAGLAGPFFKLAMGDAGVRSVQSITFSGPNGGLAALVLCRPLATVMLREITAASERDFVRDTPGCPRIVDGAYLNLLCCPNGSVAAAPLYGELSTFWN